MPGIRNAIASVAMSLPAQTPAIVPSSRLRDIQRRICSFADVCKSAQTAAAAGDVEELFNLAFRARQLRHAIATQREVEVKDFALTDVELIAEARIASEQSAPGDTLLRKLHEREQPNDDALLADPIGVISLTEALLPTTWNYEEDLVIFFGNGLDAPAEILRRVGQKRILVYLGEEEPLEFYHENVIIIRSVLALYQALASWPRPPKRIVSRSLASCSINPTIQKEVLEAANTYLGYVQVDRNTTDLFAERWVHQGIANLPYTVSCPSVANFDGAFAGKPMIIVAPGPSLCKNIKQLRKFKDKAIICTFSHTLASFAAEGIVPDIVMTVDSHPLVYHFKESNMSEVPAMVSGATVHPDLFKLPAQQHITMGANAKFDTWLGNLLGEEFSVQGGGSVATSALALALRWKCEPIVFVGLDLSFSNGRYYAETSCDGDLRVTQSIDGKQLLFDGWSDDCVAMTAGREESPETMQEKIELDGYYGGKVETTPMFQLFHDWFEKRITTVEDVAIFNCTEGGAYIRGAEHLPLAEVYNRYFDHNETFSVAETLQNVGQNVGPERRQRAVKGVIALVRNLEDCLKLVDRCDQLLTEAADNSARFDELGNAESKLVDSLRGIRFMSIRNLKEIDLAHNRAAAATNLEEVLSASRDLYTAIREEAQRTLPELRDALTQMQSEK